MSRILAITFFTLVGFRVGYAQSFTFVFLNKKADKQELPKEEVEKIMKGHLENIGRLAKEGKLVAAGPFDGGGGIFILATNSLDTANAWLSTDPGIQAKRWDVEVLPFYPRVGPPCAVKGPPYEMVNYHFVRYTAQVTKSTSRQYPEIMKRHDDHLKKFNESGTVIAEGTFGDNAGGILILKGELQKEEIENDPGIQEALLQFEIKKLYIAKGTFCEK